MLTEEGAGGTQTGRLQQFKPLRTQNESCYLRVRGIKTDRGPGRGPGRDPVAVGRRGRRRVLPVLRSAICQRPPWPRGEAVRPAVTPSSPGKKFGLCCDPSALNECFPREFLPRTPLAWQTSSPPFLPNPPYVTTAVFSRV